jgi:hypothetical protein
MTNSEKCDLLEDTMYVLAVIKENVKQAVMISCP